MDTFAGQELAEVGATIEEDHAPYRESRLAPYDFAVEHLRAIDLDCSQQWLITGLMPSTGLHVLYGAPGTGKSFVALHAALHVAAGRPWAGRGVFQGGVVYVASEGGRNFRKRVVAAKAQLKVPEDTPFVLITRAPCLGGKKNETKTLIADIEKQCAALDIQPRLIVLDTLSRSITELRESDAQDIMEFVRNATAIGDHFGALVLPIHHCGKDESRGMRGSSALHGAADAEWLVRKDSETGDRHIVVEKMKDGPDGARIKYSLVDVTLGEDETGEPIVTCLAEVGEVQSHDPAARGGSGSGMRQIDLVLAAIRTLSFVEGQKGPASGLAPQGASAIDKARLKQVLCATDMIDETVVATAIGRALTTLKKKNLVGHAGDLIWLLEGKSRQPVAEGVENDGHPSGSGQVKD